MPGRWLIVSGEASGDRLAQRVIDAAPSHAFVGMCGPTVRAPNLRARPAPPAAMGLTNVAGHLAALASLRAALLRDARGCDGALLIDLHGFNLPLGRALKSRGVRVVLLSAPQVWAWRPSRARSLGQCADVVACLLDFEPDLLAAMGVRDAALRFVGHPAAESYVTPRPDARALCLLPGSRPHEVARLGAVMAEAARVLVARGVLPEVVAACAPEVTVPQSFSGFGIERGVDAARASLARSRAAVACSGTVTLECALAAVPTVAVYRTDPLTAAVARRLVRSRHFALPNVLLGREALPELFQSAVTPAAIIDAVERSLSPEGRRAADDAARELRDRLRTPEGFARRTVGLLTGERV